MKVNEKENWLLHHQVCETTLSEKWGWVKVHLRSIIKIADEDMSLLAPLAKMEFVRKQDCVGGFDHKNNVGR